MKDSTVLIVFVVLFKGIESFFIPGLDTLFTLNSKCAEVNVTFCNGIHTDCINGVFTINGKEYKTIKPGDHVEIQFNELRVNGEFVCKIPPASGSGDSPFARSNSMKRSSTPNPENKNKCPPVARFNCKNVSYTCKKGQLYINGIKIANVTYEDKVIVVENNVRVNGEFVRYIPAADDDGKKQEKKKKRKRTIT